MRRYHRKQTRHGNWKNNWTFSLAEDGGGREGRGCQLEGRLTVCVLVAVGEGGGEEQVERGGEEGGVRVWGGEDGGGAVV